jgi:hypothetical protein
MAEKPRQPPFQPGADLRADYVLIAGAVGAAFLALIYLILI